MHIAVVFAMTLLALILFATERIRLESAALLVFVCLLLSFSWLPYQPVGREPFSPARLFLAFGNEALVAVCALMVLGKGIEATHALRPAVNFISRHWARSPRFDLLLVMLLAAILSAFMNNTPIVVMLLPALLTIAHNN